MRGNILKSENNCASAKMIVFCLNDVNTIVEIKISWTIRLGNNFRGKAMNVYCKFE